MSELNKTEFLESHSNDFEGNDEIGYTYKSSFYPSSDVSSMTGGMATTLEELQSIDAGDDDDAFTELHNEIMNGIFGNPFQGSFEENSGSGEYNWYLEFGVIDTDEAKDGFTYSEVRFYNGNLG